MKIVHFFKFVQFYRGNIPDFRDDRVYNAEEHRNRYTKAKYTDEKDYNSNNRREDKPESRPRSETQPQRKNDSDKHIEKSQSRNREDFDVRSDRNNHNLSYEQKRRRFDKDMPEEGFANNHKKYPDYDRNYKGRNDDAKDHRRFSPPRDRERDRDSRVENNSGYSKAPRNDYEPRDYSNNRKKDDNGTNRPGTQTCDYFQWKFSFNVFCLLQIFVKMILEVTKTENFIREMSFREVKEETSELYSYNCISSRFTRSLL